MITFKIYEVSILDKRGNEVSSILFLDKEDAETYREIKKSEYNSTIESVDIVEHDVIERLVFETKPLSSIG